MKMFNLGMLAVALMLVFGVQSASAVTYTVTSQKSYTDDFGNSKKEVLGTITFDSDYPCNTTTGRCGEDLLPSQIGLSAISNMNIEPALLPGGATSGGAFVLKYHSSGISGSGGTLGSVRAYYDDGTGIGPLASAPTYDLSSVAAVPFRAIGSI